MKSKNSNHHSDKYLQAFDFASALADKDELHWKAITDILLRFLEVKDSLEELIVEKESVKDQLSIEANVFLERLDLLNRQLELAFERSKVHKINCVGQAVDPGIHCVVEMESRSDVKPDIIVKEKLKGYRYTESLLRRPQVVVAKTKDKKL